MKNKKIKKILIFGAGSVGTHHANAARTLCCDVTICDTNLLQFNYMKNILYPNRYGKWDNKIEFISYNKIFKSNNSYDLIIIGVPPKNHLMLIKKCFDNLNFKKILVEKPLCVFNQNFSFIKKRKYKDKIYCGFNHSISRSFLFLTDLISRKKIGKIKKVEINWKEDFKLILRAHPWLKNINQSYLSNLKIGGGGSHEYSHAIHLAIILRKMLLRNKISIRKNIVYKKNAKIFYDSKTQITLYDNLREINLNIDTISNPCKKNIILFGDKGKILWERKIEKNYEKVEIRNSKNTKSKLFKLTRRDDFINQIKCLLFKKIRYNDISNINSNSAMQVMDLLRKIFRYV